MAISIDWQTKVIYIPQADLTPLGGSLYELDVDWFRLQLKDLEDNIEGMPFLDTHRHTTETELGGVTYARFVEIINGYTVTFEDGQYAVNLVGANNNILDVTNVNQVSLRSSNSAGLISSVVETGVSGLTEEESQALLDIAADQATIQADIATINSNVSSIQGSISLLQSDVSSIQGDISTMQVDLSNIASGVVTINTNIGLIQASISTMETALVLIEAIERGEWKIENNQMIFYNLASVEVARFNLFDKFGAPANEDVYRRVPV